MFFKGVFLVFPCPQPCRRTETEERRALASPPPRLARWASPSPPALPPEPRRRPAAGSPQGQATGTLW